MIAILFSVAAFASTFIGGLLSIKLKHKLHKVMGFTAGVLLGVVFFDVFPEIIEQMSITGANSTGVMIAIVLGFLIFHILEKTILIHHTHDNII